MSLHLNPLLPRVVLSGGGLGLLNAGARSVNCKDGELRLDGILRKNSLYNFHPSLAIISEKKIANCQIFVQCDREVRF